MAEDIFEYAAKCVANKGVFTRIGHSAKLHDVRSAFASQGGFGSKIASLGGTLARSMLVQIPIPTLGSLLAGAEESVQDWIKGLDRELKIKEAATLTDQVKFEIKDLSVEELDRYRWKVTDSMTELNKAINAFQENYRKKRTEHAACDAFLDLAMAGAQATRRIRKLRKKCMAIDGVLNVTLAWLRECEEGVKVPSTKPQPKPSSAAPSAGGLNGFKNSLAALIQDKIKQEMQYIDSLPDVSRDVALADLHGKCDRWCCFRAAGKVDNWTTCKDNAAHMLRWLSTPFTPDSFDHGSIWNK